MALIGAVLIFHACSKQEGFHYDRETNALVEEQVANLSGVADRIGKYVQDPAGSTFTRNEELGREGEQLLADFVYETELCLSCIGFSNEDLSELKKEYGDYALTAIGLWILHQEAEKDAIQTRSAVVDCLLMAVGADVFASIGSTLGTSWKLVSKKVIKTALKQAAKYFIGPVGALIAVGEFSICMATS